MDFPVNNFEACYQKGHTKEKQVAILFLLNGYQVKILDEKEFGDLWILVNGRPEIIEVKNEDNFEPTNILIELYQGIAQKRPSGLKTSESTAYIHTFKEKAVLYRTKEMRNYIGQNWGCLKEKQRLFNNADNGNGGFPLPINDFINFNWFDFCQFEDIPNSKVFESG